MQRHVRRARFHLTRNGCDDGAIAHGQQHFVKEALRYETFDGFRCGASKRDGQQLAFGASAWIGITSKRGERHARIVRPQCPDVTIGLRSEEHTSELQSRLHLVCRLLLEKKKYTSTPLPI